MIFKTLATELHYEDFGQGPAVVVLHDHPSNQELRTAVFEALAEAGCRVIIVNPAGLDSSPRAPQPAGQQTAQVLALFSYLGIGRAVVIGLGKGGYVALDLLERFPGRVAKASFVVSAELAADLRRRAGSKGTLEALRRGHCGDLKGAFLNARPRTPAPPQLPRLRAWINNLLERRRSAFRRQRRDCATLLAGLELPPLLIEEESCSTADPRLATRSGIGSFRALQVLSAPLQSLLNALLPDESLFGEDSAEVSSENH
jgi:pimeloyl-ACP methyl ester carboxylesterase